MIGRLRHAANVALTRGLKRAQRLRERRDGWRLRASSLPLLWRREVTVECPNTLFSRKQVKQLHGHVQRIAFRDGTIARRLGDRRIEGVRRWEYGVLLGSLRSHRDRDDWRALDVGTGNSTFPRYLFRTGNVGTMTTFDLPSSYEKTYERTVAEDTALGIERVHGSMLDMPFADGSFDLVTCISAIEHLDGDRLAAKHGRAGSERLPYDEYIATSRRAVDEMLRVLRPGGLLYLTTDAFLDKLQETDAWAGTGPGEPIWSAYRMEDVVPLFVEPLEAGGFDFVGGHDYSPELLLNDPDRSNYRGRYFTTFAVFARKPG